MSRNYCDNYMTADNQRWVKLEYAQLIQDRLVVADEEIIKLKTINFNGELIINSYQEEVRKLETQLEVYKYQEEKIHQIYKAPIEIKNNRPQEWTIKA